MILITEPSDVIYDAISKPIRLIITDSEDIAAKVAAVHTLGVAAFYGGASLDELQEIMTFFVEIIESDGEVVGAGDSGEVVTAALEEWGFLATQFEDLEDTTDESMEAFVEQLESSEASVQIAAGENIALLYEMSYTELEEDEDPAMAAGNSDSDESDDGTTTKMVKRYTVYRREDQLKHTLEELATASSRRITKKDRKSLHTNFADILNSVENPTKGPRYSNAIDAQTGKVYGSRMTVGLGVNSRGPTALKITKWRDLHRLNALRRILQGGFLIHYHGNDAVRETI